MDFEGQLAREVVGGVVGRLFDVGGPALGGVDEFGQGFADVAMVGAVVVEVVVELVGDGGELFEEVVSVLFAAGFAGVGEEILDRLVAGVEELDEDHDAIVGDVGGVAELLDLAFRQDGVVPLRGQGQAESEENESSERRSPIGAFDSLVFEDFGEELIVDLVELFEGGLEGVLIFS